MARVGFAFAAAVLVAGSVQLAPASLHWDRNAAQQLLAYIDLVGSHGLDPLDYDRADLLAALTDGDAVELDNQARASFAAIARDLANGRVEAGRRGRYAIAAPQLSSDAIDDLAQEATAGRDVATVLETLAPHDRQYVALRAALIALSPDDFERRRQIAINLERLRWLPRAREAAKLVVNIPEYTLALRNGDSEIAVYRVIVGKVATPTPEFMARISAVIFNPSWSVPSSIVTESVGDLVRRQPALARKRGYVWTIDRQGRLSVTQLPGPLNALGQMKLDMPNAYSVYVHDTPNRELFARADRTFSHGCIRLEQPLKLAETLLAETGWAPRDTEATLKDRNTLRRPLRQPIPIYVIYLTAVPASNGQIRYLGDPYGLDPPLAMALAGERGTRAVALASDQSAKLPIAAGYALGHEDARTATLC
jgi:murein L,D-transpeptidase YcbB/YkuD